MKYLFSLFILLVLLSCNNEKILQLPEITNSDTNEVIDVSAAYIFYDETKKDSVELNRKNLIISTNWLVNVDKRLTLKQAIPSIQVLQNKRRNAKMHKNETAKDYFTCNNTSIKNLGFIEFTDLVYYNDSSGYNAELNSYYANLIVLNLNDIKIITSDNKVLQTELTSLPKTINDLFEFKKCLIFLEFDINLTFQEYITIKSIMSKLDIEHVEISKHEFTFN